MLNNNFLRILISNIDLIQKNNSSKFTKGLSNDLYNR